MKRLSLQRMSDRLYIATPHLPWQGVRDVGVVVRIKGSFIFGFIQFCTFPLIRLCGFFRARDIYRTQAVILPASLWCPTQHFKNILV